MTKKDYILIASIIKGMPDFAPALRTAKVSYANAFADRLEEDNSKFNRKVFLDACGIEDNEE